MFLCLYALLFLFSSRRRHTRCALVTGVQTCALPISVVPSSVREGSGPFIAFASVGIGVNEADKQRAQEDVEVEWHGPVLDIVEVVLHPVLHLFDSVRLAAEAVHLCPAGDAG